MVITIGDEPAAQWRVGTQHFFHAIEELHVVIEGFNAAGVIACMICSNEAWWPLCEETYTLIANGTGGRYLVAPPTGEIVEMIVDMVTQSIPSQTV